MYYSVISMSYTVLYTFVYDGLIFNKSINKKLGDIVLRDERFFYYDILSV